jgi:hypothetical protein
MAVYGNIYGCIWHNIYIMIYTWYNDNNQGWVIRTSEASHTIYYAINTQYAFNTKTYLCYFGGYLWACTNPFQPPRIVPPASNEHYNASW